MYRDVAKAFQRGDHHLPVGFFLCGVLFLCHPFLSDHFAIGVDGGFEVHHTAGQPVRVDVFGGVQKPVVPKAHGISHVLSAEANLKPWKGRNKVGVSRVFDRALFGFERFVHDLAIPVAQLSLAPFISVAEHGQNIGQGIVPVFFEQRRFFQCFNFIPELAFFECLSVFCRTLFEFGGFFL